MKKRLIILNFIFVLYFSTSAQVINDECKTAIDYGILDGRRKCACPDGRSVDTSFVVSNLNAVPNFPYYNTFNFCYTGLHDTINRVYNDVWYKFSNPSEINRMTIFNNKSSLNPDTIRITYWLDYGNGCGNFYGGVTQIIPLINNYFYYEFGYWKNFKEMYLQITGNKPKDTIDLTICLSGSKLRGQTIPICCFMSPNYDSICFINKLSHKNPNSISSNDGSITSSVSLGNPPYKYLWNTGDTTYKIEGLKTGKYYLTVTDSIGCINKYAINLTASSSISNIKEDERIIYPNPARDYVQVETDKWAIGSHVKIYNLLGQTLLDSYDKKIDITAISYGMYIIRVLNKHGDVVKTDILIIER
jgi:hypothetical protein